MRARSTGGYDWTDPDDRDPPTPDPVGLREARTEAGRRLLDAYFQPAYEEQRLLGGGGIEHLVAAIEEEAAALATPAPLDVERLARAIGDSGAVRNIAWPPSWHNEATYAWLARSFAAEYARLAKEVDLEDDGPDAALDVAVLTATLREHDGPQRESIAPPPVDRYYREWAERLAAIYERRLR